MKGKTKRKMIEEHLIEHGSITSLEAITNYWCTRLADVKYRLQNDGWVFKTDKIKHKSGSYYAKYILINTPANYNNASGI